MRIHAAVATILAAAAGLFAGDDGKGGAELLYEFRAGEAPAAAKVLEKRLELLGVEGATVRPLEDGKRVVVRLERRDHLEDIRAMALRVGHLEFRRAADTDTREYMNRRAALDVALKGGEDVEKALVIPADSLSPAERQRAPGGLRWYRNRSPTDSPTDDWILCEIDAYGVTEAALGDVRLTPAEFADGMYNVYFSVRADFQEKVADLTSVESTRVPIIMDGEIVCAPVVRSQLRHCGTITLSERDACVVAAVLGGGLLPSKPELVAERELANRKEEDGAELLYEFRAGESPAAAKVLEKRLMLLGVEATVKPVEDGKRVVVRLDERDRLEEVQDVALRVGHLEIRRAVSPDTSEFLSRRLALQTALRRGEDVEKIREIPADSLNTEERQRSPGGLRWYKDPSAPGTPADWILCEIDADRITEEALDEIRVIPGLGHMYEVHVSIKTDFQEKMADLTSRPYTVVAVIVDGEIVGAPLIRGQIRDRGAIRIDGEREAGVIAAALGGGLLPSKPTFVAERRIER